MYYMVSKLSNLVRPLKLDRIENKFVPSPPNRIQIHMRHIFVDILVHSLLPLGFIIKLILAHVISPRLYSGPQVVHEVSEVTIASKDVGHKGTNNSPPESEAGSHCFICCVLVYIITSVISRVWKGAYQDLQQK